MLERLLVVGLGSIGLRHVRIVRELVPSVQIIALRHRDHPDTNSVSIDHCVTSVSEALKFLPQAAVIANPASHHLEVAVPLARAGLHLLVEKPISISAKGVSELIEACATQSCTLMTGYNLRFSLSLQRFRELLQENRVGSVLSVRAEVGQFLPSWRPGADYRETVSAKAALGGGVLLELSHEIDYLRWLFGEIEWVCAFQGKQSSLEIDVEDTAHLFLRFVPKSGAAPIIATLSMDCIRHDTTRTCTAIGERGSMRWDAVTGSVEIFEQGGTAWETVFRHEGQRDDSYVAEWRHFLSCISDGTPPVVSGHDGLSVIRVIEGARQSVKIGSTVQMKATG
ncbi:MAG: Gfo/Idh/MocA family oxidoreductase [Nitrospira sp.]|nr:MAG: Gfo/Idh/MocA family oxidoreductase [Nitrospira sp.]